MEAAQSLLYCRNDRSCRAGSGLDFAPHIAYVAAANAFFVVYLVLSIIKVRKLTPEYLRRNAAQIR